MDTQTQSLKIESTSGNFAWTAKCEVDGETLLALAHAGLLQICQRTPVSTWEKACAYPGEKAKRPTGFTRDSIKWSEDSATKLRVALEQAKIKIGDSELELGVLASVSVHVPGEGAVYKFATERKVYVGKAGDPARLAALAEKVSWTGDHGDGKDAPQGFLDAIRAFMSEI